MDRRLGGLAVAAMAAAGCGGGAGALAGRWERVEQPTEWVELRRDGTFLARSFMGADTVRGTYERENGKVRIHSTYGYSETLVLDDSVLVMDDGTRFRRTGRADR